MALLTFAVLIAVSTFVYAQVLSYTNPDVHLYFLPWLRYLIAHGRYAALKDAFHNYAPAYIYLLALGSYLIDYLNEVTIVKIIPIVFVGAASLLVYNIVTFYRPGGGTPVLASAGFLLLPTTVANAPLWGQADVIYTTFLLAFFYSVLKQRPLLAVVAFGLAISFKMQAVFIVPYLLFLVLRRGIAWAYLAIVPAIYVLSVLPAALAGRPMADLLTIYLAQSGTYKRLSMNAPNLYPFVQRYSPLSFGVAVGIGLALAAVVGCVLAASALRFRAVTKELHLLMATLSVALMPFLLPKMHDRYFFPADVFGFLLAFAVPRLWPVAVGFQLSSFLAYSAFLFMFRLGPPLGGLINLILLAILIAWLWRAYWSPPRGAPVAGSAAP